MAYKPTRKLRIIVLVDADLVPPSSMDSLSEKEIQSQKNEYDVITTLKKMGHEVRTVGVAGDVGVIREAIDQHRPHIAFNLLVEFHGHSLFEPHIVSYLELRRMPFTGCNPRGLMLAHDKALTKKILAFHRIQVPAFAVFPIHRKVRRPSRLRFPLLVKSVVEEGSAGISQASVVRSDEALAERVDLIHKQTQMHAIAEQYIEGREIYVALLGYQRLRTFTPWELLIQNLPEGAANIATSRIKWNRDYQARVGLATEAASLSPELAAKLDRLSKRIYRILSLSGYARLDYRLTEDGQFYLLEANPNPDISSGEDFAAAARSSGISYEELLQRIISLGLRYQPFYKY